MGGRPAWGVIAWLMVGLAGCRAAWQPEAAPPIWPPAAVAEPALVALPSPTVTLFPSPETPHISLAAWPTATLWLTPTLTQPQLTPVPSAPAPTLSLTQPTPTPWSTPPAITPLPLPTAAAPGLVYLPLGFSSQGYPLEGWQVGEGSRHIILVGGIHGGYEWNTVLLAYELLDYYTAWPAEIPTNITLTIIPVANPDGLMRVTGSPGRFSADAVSEPTAPGRFNGRNVDLNRNWDCAWSPQAQWRDQLVSGGEAPFSEPETAALRDFIVATRPAVVVFWHSAARGVYLAQCDGVQAAATRPLAEVYATAADYALNAVFAAYPITGDASDYLNGLGIPAFTVELTTHEVIEFDRNLAAVQALLARLAPP